MGHNPKRKPKVVKSSPDG